MRLDKFLKVSRIIKRRPVAKQACDAGKVLLNGNKAGAGKTVKVGDELTLRFGRKTLVIKVERLAMTVRKKEEAESLYTIISEETEPSSPLI